MTLPAGFLPWAEQRGCSPYHPDQWDAEDVAAFMAWKLDWFKSWCRAFRPVGRLMPAQHARERVREALDRLHAPPPARPFLVCPCHMIHRGRPTGRDDTPHGLGYINTFRPARTSKVEAVIGTSRYL